MDAKSPGNSLYPTDPKKRAVIDQRLYFDAGTLWPRIRAIAFPALFLGEKKIPDLLRKAMTDALEFLNTFLEGSSWIAGNDVTIADLSLLASISSIVYAGVDLTKYPNIAAWYERTKTLPGWAENDAGAKAWGEKVKGNLTDKF